MLLDTGHIAPIGGEQTDWLDTDPARSEPIAPPDRRQSRAGVSVVPQGRGPSGQGRHRRLNRKHWVPLFEKHNVDVVLEHHDHTFKRTHPLKDGRADENGMLYLGDGSWGRHRGADSRRKRGPTWRTHESYHLTLHRLEGDRSDSTWPSKKAARSSTSIPTRAKN